VSLLIGSTVSTEVIAGAIAVGGTLVTLLVVGVGRRLGRRSQASAEERMARLVQDLDSRMADMGRELAEALDRAREETRRSRFLGELAGSIDLDDVLRRTLDAAGALPGADGALITIDAPDAEPVAAATGITEDEAAELTLGPPPRGKRVRSMSITYEPGLEPLPGDPPPIRVGLAVPIQADLEPVGLLSVFSRGEPGIYSDEQLHELEDLAARAGPAIDNARRFREARQLADLDALTGLHNRRYFHETLSRECARAQRYNRRLALLVLDLDDFKAINDQIGHLAGDAVLAEIAQRVRDVVRSADIPCRVGGDEFAVILPESALEDADQLYRRLQAQISSRPVAQAGRMLLSAGIAELRPQDDSVSFFQRADDALYRAKEGGKGRVVASSASETPSDPGDAPEVSDLRR
jgi:diguanylate cyclase (GGDEF)-like protein